MQIVFKLHATLTDYLPRDADGRKPQYNQLRIEVPEDCDVQSVIDRFNLPARQVHLVLVNGVYVAPGTRAQRRLSPGDALAIWPPIAGG
jgi:molybdopterin synthase sulfur carrier subunit